MKFRILIHATTFLIISQVLNFRTVTAQLSDLNQFALLSQIDRLQFMPDREKYTSQLLELNSYLRENRNSEILFLKELISIVGIKNTEGVIILTISLKGISLTATEPNEFYVERMTNFINASTIRGIPVFHFLLIEMASLYTVSTEKVQIDLAYSRFKYNNNFVNQGMLLEIFKGRLLSRPYFRKSIDVSAEIFPAPKEMAINFSTLNDLPLLRTYKVNNKHIKRSRLEYCKLAFKNLNAHYLHEFDKNSVVAVESDLFIKLYPVNGYINNKKYLERITVQIALIQYNTENEQIEILLYIKGKYAETTAVSAANEHVLTRFIEDDFLELYNSKLDALNNLVFDFIK